MGRRIAWIGSVLVLAACARMAAPGFPPPARPSFLVNSDFSTAFNTIAMMVEARGMPVLVADSSFGSIQTDWVDWDEGEVDLTTVARCDFSEGAPPSRSRARFSFDVRRRANRVTVTIRTQWQVEVYGAFATDDSGFRNCPSTGAWERMVEEALTQRTIR